jgi:hypothetical protein
MSGTVALDHLAELIEQWRLLRTRAARLKAAADQAERDILAALGDAEIGTVGGTPMVRREVEKRQTFAFGRFSAEHPDLVDQFVYERRREHLKFPRRSETPPTVTPREHT